MRSFPLIVIAWVFCWLIPAPAWAQELHCKPCWHNFGEVQIGGSRSFHFHLANTGKKTVRISSRSEQGSAFSFRHFPLPLNIRPGASVALAVIFEPTAKGYTQGILTLRSNAHDPVLKVHVEGTGFYPVGAQLKVTPTTLNFGNVTVGSSASLQATLTASNSEVTISSDRSTSSEFAILGLNPPVTIPAGQSIQVTLQFTPNASGTSSARAGFISNAVDSPTLEALAGAGVAQTPHSVYLSWDSGSGAAVGYNIYRGTAKGGPYQMINTALEASTNYTDYTVVSGSTYYYVTTAVNAQGQESAHSNVAEAVIPSP